MSFRLAAISILALGAACGTSAGSVPDPRVNNDGGISDSGVNNDGGIPDSGVSNDPDGGCIGAALLRSLDKSDLLVGASMEDATAAAAPFDVRYLYLSGGLPDGTGPCASCASGCTSAGTSCDNAHGCGWWGCWQYDQDPPGEYATGFISKTHADAQLPMFTYYELLQASGVAEGSAEVTQAANDPAFMSRYFADLRFLLQKIGTQPALLHLEPDFWGYAEQVNGDATAIAAEVSSANSTDCADQPNTIAGFGHCLIAMSRKYAPNVKVGLHGSAWGTGVDVSLNSNASLDVAGEAQKLARFLVQCGADQGDFVAVDASDRDAGYYQSIGRNTWWDATNQALPDFHQSFAWARALAEGVGRPIVYWQVPVGNASQSNTTDHWKDNRVDYFFAHTGELAAAHVAGTFFGAGDTGQTTPESDGNNLVSKTQAYAGARQPLCQ